MTCLKQIDPHICRRHIFSIEERDVHSYATNFACQSSHCVFTFPMDDFYLNTNMYSMWICHTIHTHSIHKEILEISQLSFIIGYYPNKHLFTIVMTWVHSSNGTLATHLNELITYLYKAHFKHRWDVLPCATISSCQCDLLCFHLSIGWVSPNNCVFLPRHRNMHSPQYTHMLYTRS